LWAPHKKHGFTDPLETAIELGIQADGESTIRPLKVNWKTLS
jgi:hypothetical protein